MKLVSSPAFRPSPPHGCRKRSSGQGHALPGRFAGLDRVPLLSGYGRLRATDEEASGGGSVKGSPQFKNTNAAIQKSVFRLPRFSRIPTCGGHDAHKSASTYAPQNLPDTYGVASHAAFRYPRRHARYADLALRRILSTRLAHSVLAFAAYRLPDVYLEPSVYLPATRRIQLRSTADMHTPHSRCSHHESPFLRGCLFIRPALFPRASLRFVYTLRV